MNCIRLGYILSGIERIWTHETWCDRLAMLFFSICLSWRKSKQFFLQYHHLELGRGAVLHLHHQSWSSHGDCKHHLTYTIGWEWTKIVRDRILKDTLSGCTDIWFVALMRVPMEFTLAFSVWMHRGYKDHLGLLLLASSIKHGARRDLSRLNLVRELTCDLILGLKHLTWSRVDQDQ